MTQQQLLQQAVAGVEVNEAYSEATLTLTDGSKLHFCHKVGKRWARALDAHHHENGNTTAAALLAAIAMFRLNAKHLDIAFTDQSRWEMKFK